MTQPRGVPSIAAVTRAMLAWREFRQASIIKYLIQGELIALAGRDIDPARVTIGELREMVFQNERQAEPFPPKE